MTETEKTSTFKIQDNDNISALNKGSVFFDIETTGLSPETSSIYLIGCAYIDDDRCCRIKQWFADTRRDEAAVIRSFFGFINAASVLIHFNGRTFDIPFLKKRASADDIRIPENIMKLFDSFNIDLMKEIRLLKNPLGLRSIRQKDIEKIAGIEREDRFSGGELIKVYSRYTQKYIISSGRSLREKKPVHSSGIQPDCSLPPSLLRPDSDTDKSDRDILLLHNYCDIEGMLYIYDLLPVSEIFKDAAEGSMPAWLHFSKALHTENSLSLLFHSDLRFPADINAGSGNISVHFSADTLTIDLEIYEGTFRYYLKNYRDYYYIPSENKVIYKSLAAFIGTSIKEKASPENCFISMNGRFLKLPENLKKLSGAGRNFLKQIRLFTDDYKSSQQFIAEDDIIKTKKDSETPEGISESAVSLLINLCSTARP